MSKPMTGLDIFLTIIQSYLIDILVGVHMVY